MYRVKRSRSRFNPPTDNQITAMDAIVYYLPDLEEEREKCTTKEKASDFIGKYMQESYDARDEYLRSRKYGYMIDERGDKYYDSEDESDYAYEWR